MANFEFSPEEIMVLREAICDYTINVRSHLERLTVSNHTLFDIQKMYETRAEVLKTITKKLNGQSNQV